MRANAKRAGETLTDEEMDRVAGGAGCGGRDSQCQPGRTQPGECHMYGCSAKR
jgi:hypothetical protein